MAVIEITSQIFDQVMQDNALVVIDFWAQWCGPCVAMKKIIEKLDKEFPEVVFGGVDIETEKQLADEFQVRSVPSIMILKNQVVVYADSGALPESELRELIVRASNIDQSKLSDIAESKER